MQNSWKMACLGLKKYIVLIVYDDEIKKFKLNY